MNKGKTNKPKISRPEWQAQTARARFSEVFRLARTEGPQIITRRGKEAVIVIPMESYHKLVIKADRPKSLVQFFRESPLMGIDVDFDRR